VARGRRYVVRRPVTAALVAAGVVAVLGTRFAVVDLIAPIPQTIREH
jgi:hypothetical protein